MNFLKWAVLFVTLIGANAHAGEGKVMIGGVALLSAQTLNADTLNDRLAALTGGVPRAPIEIALLLVGNSDETPRVVIEMFSDPDSDFNRATITVMRDGFQDDSVRGDWHEFQMSRATDGPWRVAQARRANRCWRGAGKGYVAHNCA